MSNTLYTMTIIQLQGHASTNLLSCCDKSPETIHCLYQCTQEGSCGRWTALVDTFQKFLDKQNKDTNISTFFVNARLYIVGELNGLPQFPNLTLHSEILHIGWSSIALGFIPKSLACTQQTYFTHIGSKKRDSIGPANSSHKYRNSFTSNGSTAVNSSTQEKR